MYDVSHKALEVSPVVEPPFVLSASTRIGRFEAFERLVTWRWNSNRLALRNGTMGTRPPGPSLAAASAVALAMSSNAFADRHFGTLGSVNMGYSQVPSRSGSVKNGHKAIRAKTKASRKANKARRKCKRNKR